MTSGAGLSKTPLVTSAHWLMKFSKRNIPFSFSQPKKSTGEYGSGSGVKGGANRHHVAL